MKDKFKEEKYGTCGIRLVMFDSIQVIFHNFIKLRTWVYANWLTNTHGQPYTARDRGNDYRHNRQN